MLWGEEFLKTLKLGHTKQQVMVHVIGQLSATSTSDFPEQNESSTEGND